MTITRRRRIDEVGWIKLFFAIMLTVIVVNVLVLMFVVVQDASGSTPFDDVNSTEARVIEFRLNGTHYEEDEVSDVVQGLSYNITAYEPLKNRTILVTAVGEDNT